MQLFEAARLETTLGEGGRLKNTGVTTINLFVMFLSAGFVAAIVLGMI